MKDKVRSSRFFFFFLMALVFYISYTVLKPFLSLVVLALIIALIFKPVLVKYRKWFRGRNKLATTMTLFTIFITFLIPLILLGNLVYFQTKQFNADLEEALAPHDANGNKTKLDSIPYDKIVEKSNNLLEDLPFVEYRLSEDKLKDVIKQSINPISNFLFEALKKAGSIALEIIPGVILFIILVATMLNADEKMFAYIEKISPMKNEIDELYIKRVIAMAESTVKGSFVISIIQATITGFTLWLAGVDYVVFYTIIMVFAGIIPLGVGLVSIPIGIVLILTGDTWQGLFVLLSYIVVVSNLDNLLRPKLTSKDAHLHSVLILLGVLGGIETMGFMGLIYGPIVMIFLVTTIEVYLKYYRAEKEE